MTVESRFSEKYERSGASCRFDVRILDNPCQRLKVLLMIASHLMCVHNRLVACLCLCAGSLIILTENQHATSDQPMQATYKVLPTWRHAVMPSEQNQASKTERDRYKTVHILVQKTVSSLENWNGTHLYGSRFTTIKDFTNEKLD